MKRLSVDFWLEMYSEVHKGLLLDVWLTRVCLSFASLDR
jgi:hypothetical protein